MGTGRRRHSAISAAPQLRIHPFAHRGSPGNWLVVWHVSNEGQRPVRLVSAVHPHSQFRTDETAIGRDLARSASTDLELPVRFVEPPGTVVENPFLILRVAEGDAEWRVLARVSVTAGARGEPIAGNTIAISTNRVGEV